LFCDNIPKCGPTLSISSGEGQKAEGSYLVHGSLRSLPGVLSGSMIDLDHYDSKVRELGMSRPLPLPRMGRGEQGRGRRRGNDEV